MSMRKMRPRASMEEVTRLTVINDTILNYAASVQSTILGLSIVGFLPKEDKKEKTKGANKTKD